MPSRDRMGLRGRPAPRASDGPEAIGAIRARIVAFELSHPSRTSWYRRLCWPGLLARCAAARVAPVQGPFDALPADVLAGHRDPSSPRAKSRQGADIRFACPDARTVIKAFGFISPFVRLPRPSKAELRLLSYGLQESSRSTTRRADHALDDLCDDPADGARLRRGGCDPRPIHVDDGSEPSVLHRVLAGKTPFSSCLGPAMPPCTGP